MSIEQLVDIYLNEETWHGKKLTQEEALFYFETACRKDRIIVVTEHERVVGYVESWRINFEQFGRIVCHQPFDIGAESIEDGPICYLSNIYIRPSHRNSGVIRELRYNFFKQNLGAKYFVGEALRKKTQPIKVFKMQEAYKKWAKATEEERWVKTAQ